MKQVLEAQSEIHFYFIDPGDGGRMGVTLRRATMRRLDRGPRAREIFVASHIAKGVAYQIIAMRHQRGWSQAELAKRAGMKQTNIARLENPYYGKASISTLKRVAAAFDVGLQVRFTTFTLLADFVTQTPRIDGGLSSLEVWSWEDENK